MLREKPLKQEEDWVAQKPGLAYFKKAVGRAKRDSWHSFVESMNNQTPATARLVKIRGGVEDTRLEAKAKNTKKIRGQGQGQPFRGQTLSRPRTEMLEAKARDQGHKRKCSPKKKKKALHKNFSGNLHKQTFSKKFFKRSTKF